MNASTPVYVTVKQVVERFGISRATTHRKLSAGLFKGKKVGRITLVELASVVAYLDSCPNR
jgi:hypothetical protein